jgi:hypothetical protein
LLLFADQQAAGRIEEHRVRDVGFAATAALLAPRLEKGAVLVELDDP